MNAKQKISAPDNAKQSGVTVKNPIQEKNRDAPVPQTVNLPSWLFVTLYDTEQIWVKIMAARQLSKSELDPYDVCWAECLRVMLIRDRRLPTWKTLIGEK